MSVTHRWPAHVVGALLSFACALVFAMSPAWAQSATEQGAVTFDIPAQSLDDALVEFGRQSRQELFYNAEDVSGLTANAVSGDLSRTDAMALLLQGTGLQYEQTASGGMMVGTEATLTAQRIGQGATTSVPPAEAALASVAGHGRQCSHRYRQRPPRRGGRNHRHRPEEGRALAGCADCHLRLQHGNAGRAEDRRRV